MVDGNSCIAVYRTHEQVESAVCRLQGSAIDIGRISIVAKGDREGYPVGFYCTEKGRGFLGVQQSFWSGMCERLTDAGLFLIPGLGTLLVAGPLVAVVAGVTEETLAAGKGMLGAVFCLVGVPQESVDRYETAVESGRYLIVVHGNQLEVEQVHDLLVATEPVDMAIHLS